MKKWLAPAVATSRAASTLASVVLALACQAMPAHAQIVPGMTVTRYASPVQAPVRIDFAPDGALFCGRDDNPSGSVTPVRISRVDPNSRESAEYGASTISDPDVVLFDSAGVISGVAGSVIVGGIVSGSTGRISAIRPSGTVVTLWEATTITNPTEMKFDNTGRLVFTEQAGRKVMVSTGALPTTLFTISGTGVPGWLAIDSSDRIYTSSSDGKIRIHASDGTLLDDSLTSFSGYAAIEFGEGGVFGTDLYALETSSQTLYRVDSTGTRTVFGTGFDVVVGDIAFGRDGDLYTAHNVRDGVLRISESTATGVTPADTNPMRLRGYPNPFEDRVTIALSGLSDRQADVAIYDSAGRLVRQLGGISVGGEHRSIVWDGRNDAGRDVGAGAFVIRVEGGARSASRKIIRVR